MTPWRLVPLEGRELAPGRLPRPSTTIQRWPSGASDPRAALSVASSSCTRGLCARRWGRWCWGLQSLDPWWSAKNLKMKMEEKVNKRKRESRGNLGFGNRNSPSAREEGVLISKCDQLEMHNLACRSESSSNATIYTRVIRGFAINFFHSSCLAHSFCLVLLGFCLLLTTRYRCGSQTPLASNP